MTAINRQDAEQESDNVRMFPTAQQAPYPKRSYAIAVTSPAGFPILITLADLKLDQLDDALAALLERGYMPAEPNPTPAPATTGAAPQPGQPPVCPYHGAMKQSTVPGKEHTWYCPKKMADGSGYCKEKFPKT